VLLFNNIKGIDSMRWVFTHGIPGLMIGLLCISGGERGAFARSDIIVDKTTKRYHTETCEISKHIAKTNRRVYHSIAEAAAQGYYPCSRCIPIEGSPKQSIKKKQLSQPVQHETEFFADPLTHPYHYRWCSVLKTIPKEEYVLIQSPDQAVQMGFHRCEYCRPPTPLQTRVPSVLSTPRPTPPAANPKPVVAITP
jgi:hypothetical protein